MDPKYDHTKVESRIYKMWEDNGYFKPEVNPKGEPYSIILPPPNANADLHLGNALFVIEDILIRFKRMSGFSVLWLPGIDHAGILSQAVFERKLLKEQDKSRYDLGRQEFYKQVYEFCMDNKKTIESQLRAMGFSLDWSREKFTLDPEISKIVYSTFVKLFNDDLIYRGSRIINWCTKDYTTLSDLELEEKEQEDKLYYLDYGNGIQVATTRPETIFADAAVAVNPKDKRYKGFAGKIKATIPIINKPINIIEDEAVEVNFGTGALKVTPGHDMTDYEIGQRHNLDITTVIDFRGKMTMTPVSEINGLRVSEARAKTVELLGDKLLKTEPLKHSVKVCERCKTIIEPLISRQWFVKMRPLAEKGVEAVKKGEIKFTPKRWYKQYYHWMENLHDWPVSRQLWWGHRMPVYYCVNCQTPGGKHTAELIKQDSPISDTTLLEKPIVAAEKPNTCPACGNVDIIQDPDTFDTWFSSGQWPFTTLMTGQPGDFEKFYPTSTMDTGWEIFWLWVTRMIMFSLYVKNEVPFKDVLAHGMLRDDKGQKMSKSKGNGVDPLEMIAKYSADATRLGLVASRDVTTDWMISKNQLEDRIKSYRNFANKVWNIGRFISLNIEGKTVPEYDSTDKTLTADDKAIMKKLNLLTKSATTNIEKYKLGNAADQIYDFLWHELADKYIESSKSRIQSGNTVVLSTLLTCYLTSLKLLHPFMPFVTEEIWGLFGNKTPLIISPWPISR